MVLSGIILILVNGLLNFCPLPGTYNKAAGREIPSSKIGAPKYFYKPSSVLKWMNRSDVKKKQENNKNKCFFNRIIHHLPP